jgi:long-chain acyl-CoA synthetase
LDTTVEQFLLESRFIYDIGYGLTETAPLLAGAVDGMLRLGSTGPLLKGVEGRLENVNPETGIGELVVKSPSQMIGYYKNEEATKEVFTEDGWFRTGDLASFDPDGWLYIRGRLKNMILGPSGENIYPEDIESVLNRHVFITESLVTEQEGKDVLTTHAVRYYDKYVKIDGRWWIAEREQYFEWSTNQTLG